MKRNLWWIVAWALVVAAMVGLIVGGTHYLAQMKSSLQEQSINETLEVTSQGAHAFEVYVSQGMDLIDGRAKNFAQYPSTDVAVIGHTLDLYGEDDTNCVIIDLSHEVIYFNSDHSAKLTAEALAQYRALDQRGFREPYLDDYTGRRMVAYYQRFNFADGASGIVQKGAPLDQVSREFSLSFFDNAGFSYLINAAGDVMLRPQHHQTSGGTILNIFDALTSAGNDPAVLQSLQERMSRQEKGAVQLTFQGQSHIFACVPVEGTEGWYLIAIIPTATIAARTDQLLQTSQIIVLILAAVLVVFMLFCFVTWQYRRGIQSTEAEVAYREQLFNLLANNTDDVFLMLSGHDLSVEYISPNVERVLGVARKAVMENLSSLSSIMHNGMRELDPDAIRAVPLGQSSSCSGDCLHKTTGERRWFIETVYHTTIDTLERYIVIFADRTSDRQTEAALTQALEIAEGANRSKSTFLSNMSHDIRTPMNAIVGLSTLLAQAADDPERVREYTRKITASSQHLLGLINDVLDMSKIESGKVTLNLAQFKLSELIDELDTITRPQAQTKGQTLHVQMLDVRHDVLVGDKLRLNQILINLLSNAVKYTQTDGSISLTVRELSAIARHYSRLRFTVSDNGQGMSEEFLQTIFQPFTREVNSVTNEIQGTGLGMAITKNLVDLMGGVISVDSTPGRGSTFTVELELHIADESEPAPPLPDPSAAPAAAMGPVSPLAGMRILAAEDNQLNAEILDELLDLAGASCEILPNGREAVERFLSTPARFFDLILMDVQMPVMNGYDATRAIRASSHPEAATIPIIAMTANAFAEDIKDALDAGMNAHAAKPIEIPKLEQIVRTVLHHTDS